MSDPVERHPHFSVVRRLAVGGMGEVLLTRFDGNEHVTPGLVVVKRTILDHPNRPHQDEMLREEGRVALRLRHANLVDTYAVDELEGHPLLVMEYLAGRSMAQVLGAAKRKGQPVPVPVALAVLYGAACGLHFAHTLREGDTPLGLVHRDVSPANIFATFDGKVKVIDFGVAKADDSEIKTSTGILKGKLGYMSPEHAKGEKLDPRSDLWSLGVVFWEMLVADRLFGGQNPAMTLYQITQGQVDEPSKRRPDLPAAVEKLCMRLLTKDREKRVSSGADLVREIERLPADLWRDADVGGFLADRFPAEADAGRREVEDVARRTHARPMPEGLVDGGDEGSGDIPTLITGRPQRPGTNAGRSDLLVDEEAKTMAVSLDDVPAFDLLEEEDETASGSEAVTLQMPAARPAQRAPQMSSVGTPIQQLAGPAAAGPSNPSYGPGFGARPQPEPMRHSGPVPAPPPTARQSGPVPSLPQHVRHSGPVPVASGPVPVASVQSAPPQPAPAAPVDPRGQSAAPAAIAAESVSAPAVADPRSARPRTGDHKRPRARSRRHRGPSSAAVALSTFGGLAAVMGIVFAVMAADREVVPLFVGYMTADGTDAVVARIDDVPPTAGPPFQVNVDAAQLALERGKAREPVPRAALERELRKSGVWQRAELPKTPRARAAAALPAAITLLGLLSLAFSLPALLLGSGARQLATRAGLVLLTMAGGGFLMKTGGLSWPGMSALEEPEQAPRLALGSASDSLQGVKLTPEQSKALEAALVESRAAILRGAPEGAVNVLVGVVELKADLPEIYGLLGDAHRDLGKHNLAEGHYLRYLQLKPDAPDRADVEAYLRKLRQGG